MISYVSIGRNLDMTDHRNDRKDNILKKGIDSHIKEEDIVCFSVCGMRFDTLKSTLSKFPATLLGNEQRRNEYFVESKGVYFFDRNRECFEAILYYYQSGGELIRPKDIPVIMFAEEVAFFELGEEAFLQLQQNDGFYIEKPVILPKIYWQKKIWQLLEHPNSSLGAKLLSYLCILVIILSTITSCFETMPQYRVINNNGTQLTMTDESVIEPWFSIELGCIVWFAVEYIARLISSPNKKSFMKSFLNIIDLLVIFPAFISLLLDDDLVPRSVLKTFRLVRAIRIVKLSRHSRGLRILGLTLRDSLTALLMLIICLLLATVLFSSTMYYAEHERNPKYRSIPESFWYSVITMTTVGYGDMVPITVIGKMIGAVCAISGVLSIAIPLPIIVNNFQNYYDRHYATITDEGFQKSSDATTENFFKEK